MRPSKIKISNKLTLVRPRISEKRYAKEISTEWKSYDRRACRSLRKKREGFVTIQLLLTEMSVNDNNSDHKNSWKKYLHSNLNAFFSALHITFLHVLDS
jgi:hypothetical protein